MSIRFIILTVLLYYVSSQIYDTKFAYFTDNVKSVTDNKANLINLNLLVSYSYEYTVITGLLKNSNEVYSCIRKLDKKEGGSILVDSIIDPNYFLTYGAFDYDLENSIFGYIDFNTNTLRITLYYVDPIKLTISIYATYTTSNKFTKTFIKDLYYSKEDQLLIIKLT